jgi:hypothetical protein
MLSDVEITDALAPSDRLVTTWGFSYNPMVPIKRRFYAGGTLSGSSLTKSRGSNPHVSGDPPSWETSDV